jgi:hypothetical protein
MAEMKECFGQLANMHVKYRDMSRQHFLAVDEEKLKECDTCHLFTKCMFMKNNDLIRDLLKRIDDLSSNQTRSR